MLNESVLSINPGIVIMAAEQPAVDWTMLVPTRDVAVLAFATQYVMLSAGCLYVYEYLLTLPTEVRIIWSSPAKLASIFYLIIRYCVLLTVICTMARGIRVPGPMMSPKSCQAMLDVIVILNFVTFTTISAFVAMRLFAIYSRNWFLAISMFILGIFTPYSVSQIVVFKLVTNVAAPWPIPPCLTYASGNNPRVLELGTKHFPLALSSISMGYEVLCVALTASKTLRIYKMQRSNGMPTGLMLRDGLLYFVVLLALATLNILSVHIDNEILGYWQVNTDLARCLVPILTMRFIVHLREHKNDDAVLTSMNTFGHGSSAKLGLGLPSRRSQRSTNLNSGPIELSVLRHDHEAAWAEDRRKTGWGEGETTSRPSD